MGAYPYLSSMRTYAYNTVLGAGLEPAFGYPERDFKSLASTHFAIRAVTLILRDRVQQYTNWTASRVAGQPAGIPSTLTAYQTE